jgi:dTDP-4-dehydrorhamnose reductase
MPAGLDVIAPAREATRHRPSRCLALGGARCEADLIIHPAFTAVVKAESEPDLARRINADAPAVLAEEAATGRRADPFLHRLRV